MSATKCRPVKGFHASTHRPRHHHRPSKKYYDQSSKSDILSDHSVHGKTRQSRKISPLYHDENSSATTTNHHSDLDQKSNQKRNHEVNSLYDNEIQHNYQSSSKILSHPLSSRVFYGFNEDINPQKKRRRRKKSAAYCHFCTPLCAILTALGTLLLGIIIAAILVGILTKKSISTTSTTTSTSTSTSSSSTSSTSSTTSSTSSSTSTSISSTSSTTSSTSSSTSTSTSTTSTTTRMLCNYSCLNQTWISSTDLIAKWNFDGTYLDDMNTYTVIPVNSPTFVSNGYVNQAVSLNGVSNQYLYTSYIPLIKSSFTVEVWLYPTGFSNPSDHGILGLCTFPGNDECLHLTIRKSGSIYALYMSFFGDNCVSTASISVNQWIHAAFTFDNNTRAMSIYLNGYLVGYNSSVLPLQGTANNVTIGYIPGIVTAYGTNYFQGYIDQLTIANRAKPPCEILDDATLSTYYKFDNNLILNDSGPNALISTSQDVLSVSPGHLSDAISFYNSTSYLEIVGVTSIGRSNKPFSISLWIRPYSLLGTLVFVSQTAIGSIWCIPFIGFSNNGSLVAQIWTGAALQSILGPAIPTSSTWHHIVQTWSSTNGLKLYIDNVLVASDASATTYSASSISNYVRLGNRPGSSCVTGQVGSPTYFRGDMDDFRIYSRELSVDDICTLRYL